MAEHLEHEFPAMAANTAEAGHPVTQLAAQIACAAQNLEDVVAPVPRDRVIYGPWPEDLTDPDQAALLPHLGKALIHLGICVEAIAAEPGFQGNPRNSLALVGHLLARAAAELSASQHSTRTVRDAGGPPALSSLDFPNLAAPPAPARTVASRRAAGQATRPTARGMT